MSETSWSPDHDAATSPTPGQVTAVMSARHAWLTFTATGRALAHHLTDDPTPWQEVLLAEHRTWYGADAPTQVSGAFVLQYLLQLPAHTAATAAGIGMRCTDLADLTFALGDHGVPREAEIGSVEPLTGDLGARLARAEKDYREIAVPLAQTYRSTRPMSTQQRLGMVDDMWAEARRTVRSGAGIFDTTEPRRASCCLIYALPGCVQCAGCPRQSTRR